MTDIRTAYSTKSTAAEALAEIKGTWAGFEPRTVICFASPRYDPGQVSRSLQDSFARALTFGCTTSGEIVSGKMLKQSLVVMGLGQDVVEDAHIEVVHDLAKKPDIKSAFAAMGRHFGQAPAALDHEKYVGIVLFDGLSGAEERAMEKIGTQTNAFFVGGSAGDDLKFTATHVFAKGEAHRDAAVMVLMKMKREFAVIKTQSVRVLDKKLTVTKADEAKREVIEFDNKPATVAYGELVGRPAADVAQEFMRHPLGLLADGEPFIRSPQKTVGNTMRFYCSIMQGMEVSLLEATDIPTDTEAAVRAKEKEWGTISGLINFHCILRTLELESKGQTERYGKIFTHIPTVGFSTYGEAFLGHINQTSTILAIR